MDDVINGMNQVFNFHIGPAAVIFAVDLIFDGDSLSGRFSIGFHSPLTQSVPIVGNLLGNESGKYTEHFHIAWSLNSTDVSFHRHLRLWPQPR